MAGESETKPTGFFKKIFYHPNFNVIAGLFGIVGVLFGIFTYFASIEKPELTYDISPFRTPIVQKGIFTNFSVSFQGTPIEGNLSGAQITISNQGKKPIRKEDILKAVTIKTPNGEPIYQATETVSRDVVGFNWVDYTNHESGLLVLDWKILEQNDEIKLQIIYGGNVNLPFIIEGLVVGQRNGILHYHSTDKTEIIQLSTSSCVVLFTMIVLWASRIKSKDTRSALTTVGKLMVMLALCVQMLYLLYILSKEIHHT